MQPADPVLLSIDIETYGACDRAMDGDALPRQSVFHPVRSIATDLVPPRHLVLTCTLTLVGGDPWSPHEWTPGETMTLDMSQEGHRECLCRWLDHSTHLLGANLQFDVLYLRRMDPSVRLRLGGRHVLLDLTVLNYLHSEFREGGLKSLGESLGTHAYAATLKEGRRFAFPRDPGFLAYCAADTHNTVLAAAELGRLVRRDWKGTDKHSPECLRWYSDTIWTAIRMSEAGIPMHSPSLVDMGKELQSRSDSSIKIAKQEHGLILEGEGSQQSREEFLDRCIRAVPDVLDHPMLEVTPKTRKVSWSSGNRKLILSMLPEDRPERAALEAVDQHSSAQKIIGTYLWPLLKHRKNDPGDKRSVLIPWTPSRPTKSSSDGSAPTGTSNPPASTTPSSASPPGGSSPPTSEGPTAPWASSPTSPTPTCPTSTSSGSSAPSSRRRPSRSRPESTKADSAAFPTWYVVPGRFKESEDQGGTVQARITCKHPSAQTFPPEVKKAIRSRWWRGSLMWADLSQVEMRVAAILSGDPELLRSFHEDRDMHSDRAVALFGPGVQEDPSFADTWRQVGKTINFADLFLASAHRMQQSAWEMTGRLIELGVFEEAVKRRPVDRPGLWAWQQSLLREVDQKGVLHVPLTGQSRTFVGGSRENMNAVVNFPVQTNAANATLAIQHELSRLLPRMDQQGPRIVMCMQIYDSILLDVPHGREDEAASLFRTAVSNVSSPSGYWGRMEARAGNSVALKYKASFQT